jgi:hypothetical protein
MLNCPEWYRSGAGSTFLLHFARPASGAYQVLDESLARRAGARGRIAPGGLVVADRELSRLRLITSGLLYVS